jgi:O-antigen/teichoic acid export membrane protein
VVTHTTAASGTEEDAHATISLLRSVFIVMALPLLFLMFLGIPFLQEYLHYYEWLPFVAIIASAFISLLATFNTASLQGKKDFVRTSFSGIIQAVVKLIAAIALIYIGLGVFGGVLGFVLAGITSYIYTIPHIKKWHFTYFKSIKEFLIAIKKILPELRYGALSFIALASMGFLFTYDVLVVKHYFSVEIAGMYAGISAIAKIAYFGLTPLSAVLLPFISGERDMKVRSRIVSIAAAVLSVVSIIGFAIVWYWHGFITSLLFGERFVQMSYILPLATGMMILLAFLQTIVMYGLAIRAKILAIILPLSVLLIVLLNNFRHQDINTIVINFIIAIIVPIILFIGVYMYGRRPSLAA